MPREFVATLPASNPICLPLRPWWPATASAGGVLVACSTTLNGPLCQAHINPILGQGEDTPPRAEHRSLQKPFVGHRKSGRIRRMVSTSCNFAADTLRLQKKHLMYKGRPDCLCGCLRRQTSGPKSCKLCESRKTWRFTRGSRFRRIFRRRPKPPPPCLWWHKNCWYVLPLSNQLAVQGPSADPSKRGQHRQPKLRIPAMSASMVASARSAPSKRSRTNPELVARSKVLAVETAPK